MATTKMTAASFKETVTRPGIVILDWWAPWCAPCRAFAPVFEAASNAHPDITFGKVNTDEESSLAGAYGIRSIPTVSVFRDGILVFEQPGVLPKPLFEQLIGRVRELDMDDVRRQAEPRAAADR